MRRESRPPSGLSQSARALREALDALADALADPQHDAIARSEHQLEARACEFRAAVLAAADGGATLASDEALGVQAALRRCRRLGASLSLLVRACRAPHDASNGYTAAGHTRPIHDEVPSMSARG